MQGNDNILAKKTIIFITSDAIIEEDYSILEKYPDSYLTLWIVIL